jgi:hypothetical protein
MATVGVNSYISLADFKAWADLRAYDYSSYTDAQIEAATVVSAVDFIDPNYTFKGTKVSDTQPMDLPTSEVAIADILNGAAQAAWQQLQGLLFVKQSSSSNAGQIKKTSKKLGSLETSVEYVDGTTQSVGTYFDTTVIDNFLRPYLDSASASGGIQALRVL